MPAMSPWLLTHYTGDSIGRVTRMWETLLPAIVVADSLPYFRQFLARDALRYQNGTGGASAAER